MAGVTTHGGRSTIAAGRWWVQPGRSQSEPTDTPAKDGPGHGGCFLHLVTQLGRPQLADGSVAARPQQWTF